MSGIVIDYLTFSLKPDKLSPQRRDIDLQFVVDFLNLGAQWTHFENIGGRNGYAGCYTFEGVMIHIPAPDRYEDMGFCCMFKGGGLRWYASLFPAFDLCGFLRRLVSLTDAGLSLNVSRIDVAMDDKPEDGPGLLDLDEISRKAQAHEYVSPCRSRQTVTEYVNVKGDAITGRTLYFGSRKSSAFVRIYDKAAEQGVAGHWVRVEYEFKQETAVRLVNAMVILGESFPAEFPKIANRYLRFIELDDCNRSRCSVSEFWARFMGTVQRMKLSIVPYKKQTLSRLFSHVMHAYAPSLTVLLRSFPENWLVDMIRANGGKRLKRKHYAIMARPDDEGITYNSAERWRAEIPAALAAQLRLAG